MQITDWLTKNEISDAAFAARIGVSRQALWRYKSGERIPRPNILKRIQGETGGQVEPADFFATSEAAA
jgi:transcriptional regulator with XRE-family HTH domain